MSLISLILIGFVAVLHFYFLVLEMFLWTKPLGLKTFRNTPEKAVMTKVLAANQGLYNGFLVAGLLWSLIHSDPIMQKQLAFFFLTCVMIAGLYGAYSVSKRILYVQFGPAFIAALTLWFL